MLDLGFLFKVGIEILVWIIVVVTICMLSVHIRRKHKVHKKGK